MAEKGRTKHFGGLHAHLSICECSCYPWLHCRERLLHLESVALWAVCSLNVARLASYFSSVYCAPFGFIQPQKCLGSPVLHVLLPQRKYISECKQVKSLSWDFHGRNWLGTKLSVKQPKTTVVMKYHDEKLKNANSQRKWISVWVCDWQAQWICCTRKRTWTR